MNVVRVCDLNTDDTTIESSVVWAEYTKDILGHDLPDAVFSSEEYGERWATALHCDHVRVDALRSLFPISGTAIRNDPYHYWQYIMPAARKYYVKKALIVGAESTGKTTLATWLAEQYGTFRVPEYGRMYVENKGGVDNTNKTVIFGQIVNKQIELEKELLGYANRVLFCDTDLYTTYLWDIIWRGQKDALNETILAEAERMVNSYDIVLIQDYRNTDWVDDGMRDQPNTREWFTDHFLDWFGIKHDNVKLLTGTWEHRNQMALDATNELFRESKTLLPT